jgi:hypothetical protein
VFFTPCDLVADDTIVGFRLIAAARIAIMGGRLVIIDSKGEINA